MSRRMLAVARDGSEGGEEARAFLQRRLELYCRVMFWAFVTLRAFEAVMYAAYPQIKPRLYQEIFATGILGLVAMALGWRGLLVRHVLSLRTLARVDLAYTLSSGLVFGATALLAYDRHESAYTCLIYSCFVIMIRAILVPSSGGWTAKVSAISFAPLVIAAAGLAFDTKQEIPGPAFFACAAIYVVLATTIATAGSMFIHGLRRRVRERARLGSYTLEGKIGEGGMGVVYLARHARLRRPTAVKLLHPKRVGAGTLARFEREVRQMSQLTHPNTVSVFDYGHNLDGVFYYAMEYLDGIDLQRLVQTYGPQPVGRVIDILVQVCGALHEAHVNGLVHRDIKPANILLCERGGRPDVVKVVDFGLAREHADLTPSPIVGTPAYMAPEAIVSPDTVGCAVDLYALGAVAYFLLTGRPVFDGDLATLCHHQVATSPDAPGASPALDGLVLECLAKDPKLRPASATAIASRLAALRDGSWTTEKARLWWIEFRIGTRTDVIPTDNTITIDLGARVR